MKILHFLVLFFMFTLHSQEQQPSTQKQNVYQQPPVVRTLRVWPFGAHHVPLWVQGVRATAPQSRQVPFEALKVKASQSQQPEPAIKQPESTAPQSQQSSVAPAVVTDVAQQLQDRCVLVEASDQASVTQATRLSAKYTAGRNDSEDLMPPHG